MFEADEGQAGEGHAAEAAVFGAKREPTVLSAQVVSAKHPKQHTAPKRLRDSHHRVARLAAMGLRVADIIKRSGYSSTRIYALLDSPAFQELIARYRAEVDESWREAIDEYHVLATTNMLMAERQLNDKLHDADELDEPLPIKDLVSISRDAADRFGYGKRETRLNLNVDFASQLERAIQRSGKVIDAAPAGLVPTNSERRLEASSLAQPGPSVYRAVPEGSVIESPAGGHTGVSVLQQSVGSSEGGSVSQQAKPGPRRAPFLPSLDGSERREQPQLEPLAEHRSSPPVVPVAPKEQALTSHLDPANIRNGSGACS